MSDGPGYSPRSREAAPRHLERTNRSRLTLASGTAGVCAVAAAIAWGGLFHLGVSPNQLPGYAKTINLDPRNDILRLLLLALLPLIAGLGVRRLLAARLGASQIGLTAAVANAILAWSFLAGPAAAHRWAPLQTAPILLLVSIAEVFWINRKNWERGWRSFALSALTLPIALWGSRPETVSWIAGLAVLALPMMTVVWKHPLLHWREVSGSLVSFVLLPGSFVALGAAACLRLPPVADVFEDGHGLLPASEYLRGKKPFQDILPGHGLLSDGGVQFASLRLFGDDYTGLRRGAKVVGALFWPAIYFVGFAATGSAVVGFWALFLSFLWFPQYMFLRVIASLAVLALASAASRTGRRGLWIAAGAALPPAVLSAVDFAGFAAIGCVVAILVSRRGWKVSLSGFASGLLLSGAAAGALLAIAGELRSFLIGTFLELGGLFPVYAFGFHVGTPEVRQWLSGWAFLSFRESFFGFALLDMVVAVAMLAARFPQIGQRGRALAPVLAWFLAAMISVIERRHTGYPEFVLPIAVVLACRYLVGWFGWGSIRGALAVSLLAAFVSCAKPLSLAEAVADALATLRAPPGLAQLQKPPRARGALFSPAQQILIFRTEEFLRSQRFSLSDTWLDFANAPGLYYLFNRECPIRYYEVPFYEGRAAQEAVIRSVETNPQVRAVLLRTGLPSDAIDGIPNSQRAPLVFEYVERSFHPAFVKDGVEFWMRNPSGERGLPGAPSRGKEKSNYEAIEK